MVELAALHLLQHPQQDPPARRAGDPWFLAHESALAEVLLLRGKPGFELPIEFLIAGERSQPLIPGESPFLPAPAGHPPRPMTVGPAGLSPPSLARLAGLVAVILPRPLERAVSGRQTPVALEGIVGLWGFAGLTFPWMVRQRSSPPLSG